MRTHFRKAFDFSEKYNGQIFNLGRGNANLHAGEVDYFTDEIKFNSFIEFVGLRPKMYSLTLCDAFVPIPMVNYTMDLRHKAVAKGVARSQIKRVKQDHYVRIYNCKTLTT